MRIVLTAALALIAGCGKAESPGPAQGSPGDTAATMEASAPEAAPAAPADPVRPAELEGWTTQTSEEGGYSVLAPTLGQPQYSSTQTIAGPAKTTTIMHMGKGYDGALMVMYMDMPVKDGTPLAVDRGLEDGRDRAVAAYNGTLLRDEKIEIDGHPAREFEFDAQMPAFGTVHVVMRGAFRGARVYMVGGIGRKDDAAYTQRSESFVRSFKILAAAPKPQ